MFTSFLARSLVLVSLVVLTACSSDDSTATSAQPAGAGADAAPDPALNVLGCADEDLASEAPFTGPGYDAGKGGLVGEPQATYLAATTVFAHRTDPEGKAKFLEMVRAVVAQSQTSPGFIGHELAFSAKCNYARTITVWKDESAMMTFVTSGAHLDAITKVREVGDDGRTIDWEIKPADLPISWGTARVRLAPTLP